MLVSRPLTTKRKDMAAMFGLLCSLAGCLADRDANATPPDAAISTSDLKYEIKSKYKRINSLHVTYRSYRTDAEGVRRGLFLHRVVDARMPGYWRHESAHGGQRFAWQDDPKRLCTIVRLNSWYTFLPVNRKYMKGDTFPDASLPGSMSLDIYFAASGIWPLQRPGPSIDGVDMSLCDVANSEDYLIRPKQERVQGHWCHVLEHRLGTDILWFDANRPLKLVAREQHDSATSRRKRRFEFLAHTMVDVGILLPTAFRNIHYDYSATTEQDRERKVIDSRIDVVQLSVNDVVERAFDIRIMPGSLRTQAGKESPFVHAGGIDHLDELCTWIQKYRLRAKDRYFGVAYFWFAVTSVVGCTFLEIRIRRRRHMCPD